MVFLTKCDTTKKKMDIGTKYGIPLSTLSTIIKNAEKINGVLDEDAGRSTNRKKIQKAMYYDVEESLFKWFIDVRAVQSLLKRPMIQ